MTGGGLPSEYEFAQLHFHWGETDFQGSEHTISDVRKRKKSTVSFVSRFLGYEHVTQ